MADINKNVKSICSFYASECHLVTMLLPNIDKKINTGVKITTILEKDLTKEMKTLLKNLHIENQDKILNIGWGKTETTEIKSKIKNNDYIIVNGTKDFVKNVRDLIEKNVGEKEITLLECYDIEECKYELKEILDEHDMILNTSGEKDKQEYITTIKIAN